MKSENSICKYEKYKITLVKWHFLLVEYPIVYETAYFMQHTHAFLYFPNLTILKYILL